MNASGLFFLRQSACSAVTSGGERSVILPLCERAGRQVRHVTALWTGPIAAQFFDAHGPALRAGRALSIELMNLRVHHTEIMGDVLTCELAPDR